MGKTPGCSLPVAVPQRPPRLLSLGSSADQGHRFSPESISLPFSLSLCFPFMLSLSLPLFLSQLLLTRFASPLFSGVNLKSVTSRSFVFSHVLNMFSNQSWITSRSDFFIFSTSTLEEATWVRTPSFRWQSKINHKKNSKELFVWFITYWLKTI